MGVITLKFRNMGYMEFQSPRSVLFRQERGDRQFCVNISPHLLNLHINVGAH